MSKSLNNYIGITDAPGEMFSKIVSMPDTLIWRYFELLSFRSMDEISALRQAMDEGKNPKDIKIELAKELVARFHGEAAAANADKSAGNIISEGEVPQGTPDIDFELNGQSEVPVSAIINRTNLAQNAAQAKDMLVNGRVKVDWAVVDATRKLAAGVYIIQAGKKKIARVTVR
ncbi:Tyrosyl-tRNA synthetase [hydrothermal vent metagenome]|uniref:Tyrosyl-tRNA synthetase n=1 Tax=hydrothermal vent metagenome TaxID=652676 RepID=A0A3B0YH36_9ZZZZ